MKKIILFSMLCLVCTSCATTGNKKIDSEVQEDFNQSAIYFIKTDAPKLVEYMDKDKSITNRERQTVKRRIKNLNDIIIQIENKE